MIWWVFYYIPLPSQGCILHFQITPAHFHGSRSEPAGIGAGRAASAFPRVENFSNLVSQMVQIYAVWREHFSYFQDLYKLLYHRLLYSVTILYAGSLVHWYAIGMERVVNYTGRASFIIK
jgi:hypothetical protein